MGSVLDLQPASVCVLCCASRPRSLQRGTALAGMGWGLVGILVPTPRPCLGLPWASQPAYIPELPGASRRVPLPCPLPGYGPGSPHACGCSRRCAPRCRRGRDAGCGACGRHGNPVLGMGNFHGWSCPAVNGPPCRAVQGVKPSPDPGLPFLPPIKRLMGISGASRVRSGCLEVIGSHVNREVRGCKHCILGRSTHLLLGSLVGSVFAEGEALLQILTGNWGKMGQEGRESCWGGGGLGRWCSEGTQHLLPDFCIMLSVGFFHLHPNGRGQRLGLFWSSPARSLQQLLPGSGAGGAALSAHCIPTSQALAEGINI